MKIINLSIALTLATSWSAFGKASFFTRTELIEESAVIAIVIIEEPVKTKPAREPKDPFNEERPGGKAWTYDKQEKINVEKVLKGKISEDVVLYREQSFICAQYNLAKGRFLVFLTRDGDLWVRVNWQLSLRPIQETEVEWYFSKEQRYPMTFQKLDDIVAQIHVGLKKQQSKQDNVGQPATNLDLSMDRNQKF